LLVAHPAGAATPDISPAISSCCQKSPDRVDNALKNAPHTAAAVTADDWRHAYRREEAAFPTPSLRAAKYWPPVARVDNVYGDRHLFCSCIPIADYADGGAREAAVPVSAS
jgi:hypothetical protein